MDISNSIFFIMCMLILYLPSVYIQFEYLLSNCKTNFTVILILLMPALEIYYTLYLNINILSIMLILVWTPVTIISLDYIWEGNKYEISTNIILLLPPVVSYYGWYLNFTIFPFIITYGYFLISLIVYFEYILKNYVKYDFATINILLLPIVLSYYGLYLKFNILTIMLILLIFPLIFIYYEYIWDTYKYDIIVIIILLIPPIIIYYGCFLKFNIFFIIISIHYIMLISDYYIFWIYNRKITWI